MKFRLIYGFNWFIELEGDITLEDLHKYMIKKKIMLFTNPNTIIDFSKVVLVEEQEAKK